MNQISTKICIIGSGFCGYTAYQSLSKTKSDILVVEGGSENTPKSQEEQSYYKTSSNSFIKTTLEKCKYTIANRIDLSWAQRKYTLGGSSECWTGWIKPLENSTYLNIFKSYPLQNWNGISLGDYQKEALEILKSPIENFDPYYLARELNIQLPTLPKGLYYTVYAWADQTLRLKQFWQNKVASRVKDLTKERNLLIGYQFYEFLIENGKITGGLFRNINGQKLLIRSDFIFLCTGGVENAKLINHLESSKPKLTNYKVANETNLGNFQEHPHIYTAASFNSGESSLPSVFRKRYKVKSGASYALNNGLIKFAVTAWDGIGTPKVSFEINPNGANATIDRFKHKLKQILKRRPIPISDNDYIINMRCEQTPNQKSKLSFSNSSSSLNWNVISDDFKYYSDYLRRFASFLTSNKFCTDFEISSDEKCNYFLPETLTGGAHHMGTVPYSQNSILIDSNFSHHEYNNLYIVGTSAFPTSGFENPTHAAITCTLSAVEHCRKLI